MTIVTFLTVLDKLRDFLFLFLFLFMFQITEQQAGFDPVSAVALVFVFWGFGLP